MKRGIAARIRRGSLFVLLLVVLRSLCFPAKAWANGNPKIDLPRPDLLLNHMAERYTSTRRILMEFVDNSFDDAEAFFDEATDSYTRPVRIRVVVDPDQRTLAVIDNCQGMDPNKLAKVTTDVGMSEKRGQSFANGQFGFGMQAFRACCKRLRVRSRTGSEAPLLEIEVPRNQTTDFKLVQLESPEDMKHIQDSGTMVMLEEIEDVWASGNDDLSVEGCADEIENHFERLLSRGNLEVLVTGPSNDVRSVCQPLLYDDNDTDVVVDASFPVGDGQIAKVMLAIGSMQQASSTDRRARFFVKGRRIGKVTDTKTFFSASANRWKVWNHPQLIGYIDVLGNDGGPLQPMITRDEFKQTTGRAAAYAKISQECEKLLSEAIEKANRRTADESMQGMEQALTAILSSLIKEDAPPESGGPKIPNQDSGTHEEENATKLPVAVDVSKQTAEKKEKKAQESSRERKKKDSLERLLKNAQFPVQFVDGLPDPADPKVQRRSELLGNKILVNKQHKDFIKRFKYTKAGQPVMDQRIAGYIANLVTPLYLHAHYKDSGKQATREEWYDDYLNLQCKMEAKIFKALPGLISSWNGLRDQLK